MPTLQGATAPGTPRQTPLARRRCLSGQSGGTIAPLVGGVPEALVEGSATPPERQRKKLPAMAANGFWQLP
eukprot:15477277-Alexandrium_andersonii.AAC.1